MLFAGIVTTLSSIDSDLDRPFRPLNLVPQQLEKITFSKSVDIQKNVIFNLFNQIENYPKILPKNILSVEKISNNVYDVTLIEKGISAKLTTEHTSIPFEKQIIKVIDGDAQGTIITQTFESIGNKTKISVEIDLKTRGVLTPFSFIPQSNLSHAIDTIITTFVDYSKRPYTQNEKIVDDLYREILLRPADTQGLSHFSNLLEKNEISINQIRTSLLESEEYDALFSTDLIAINSLKNETKTSIDELYDIVLRRNTDNAGLQYFGSALENQKMSLKDITIELLISEEFLSLPVETRETNESYSSNESWQIINQTYYELNEKYPKKKIVRAYGIFYERGDLTLSEIKELFEN